MNNKHNYEIIKTLKKAELYSPKIVDMIKKDKDLKILKKYPSINKKKSVELDILLLINTLNKEKQKFLMTLDTYFFDKCNLEYYVFKKKTIIKKAKYCLNIIVNNKGKTIYDKFSNYNNLKKEKYSLIVQVIYSLDIIRKLGYIHNDPHSGNITCEKATNPIKIGTKKINTKYQFSLIDFDASFSAKETIYDKGPEKFNGNWDLIYFTRQVILQQDNLIKLDKRVKWVPKFKMENLKEIMQVHTKIWNKIKKTLSKKGRDYIKWFKIFESNQIEQFYTNFNEDIPLLKLSGKDFINFSIREEIQILLSAYNKKVWLEINGFNVYLPNLVPKEDIEFIILNLKNNNKIINYFNLGFLI